MQKNLSDNDKRAYSFIRNEIIHKGISPTLEEIRKVIKKESLRSSVLVLERLKEAGLIERSGRKIWLVNQGVDANQSVQVTQVPLIGTVAAGTPIFAEENIEATIAISREIARPGSEYFILRVEGDSMDEAAVDGVKISDGDLLLVRRQSSADDGQIVVALINDEATVKYLERKDNLIILRPSSSNSIHKPIVLSENCQIQGVVTAVLPPDLI